MKVKDLSTQNEEVVFTISGDQLSGWHLKKIDIGGESSYQVNLAKYFAYINVLI